MNEELSKAQDIILSKINQICRKLGLNSLMSQLYTVLYLSDGPMPLDSMVERLKISKGSVSVNIRALERYGAAKKVWVKGSRKDYYEAEMDIINIIIERVKSLARDRLLEVEDMLRASYGAINHIIPSNKKDQQTINAFKQKLDTLRNFQQKAKSMYDLFNTDLLNNVLINKENQAKKEKNSGAEIEPTIKR